MNPQQAWTRINAVLSAALEAPAPERAALLTRLCDGDSALRREVESLLAAHGAAGDFLEASAASFATPYLSELSGPAPPSEEPGAVIGRYRLLTEIGRGGMGAVWLAERADGQFAQRVALKLIKRGMDSDEILARFLRERQILARLTHPNIARLLDGGVSDEGRPYFVMEYVPGAPITRYCDAQRLPVDARLALFSTVCRAVQYAHRNLVVHRDLKPSNVLVTEQGEIKLLDFGVAKLLGDGAGEDPATAQGAHSGPMTPEYASPEQATGGAVTTASDGYQLGILLYELLTGRRPYAASEGSTGELARVMLERAPVAPSQAVTRPAEARHRDGRRETIAPGPVSEQRSTTPERLRRSLRGDLDTITLRALRSEPEQRYPSAEDLAEDVGRHLAHLPIRFGGDGVRYRMAKFGRRHRSRVIAAGLLAVAGLGFGTMYLVQIRVQRDLAQREAAKASESAALLQHFFQGWSPDAAERRQVSADKVLADAARRAELELGKDPETLASMLSLFGALHSALGQLAGADTLLARAQAIQERLFPGASGDLAATLARRGKVLIEIGSYGEAETTLRRALGMYRTVLPPGRLETRAVESDLAQALSQQGKLHEADRLLRDALGSSPNPETPVALELAANLGYTLFLEARYDEAATILEPVLTRQLRTFGRLHQSTLRTTRFLASARRDQGALREAEQLNRESLEITRALYGEDHSETAASRLSLAIVLERKPDFAEAESLANQSLQQAIRVYGENNLVTALRLRTLGGIRLARGDAGGAEALLRRALAAFRSAAPARNPDEGDVLNRLAYVLLIRGSEDAMALYREATEFERQRAPDAPIFVTDGYEYLAEAARLSGDYSLAERLYRRALALDERQLPAGHPYRAAAVTGLGRTLLQTGRTSEAERYLREGLAQWKAARPFAPRQIAEVNALLARPRPVP